MLNIILLFRRKVSRLEAIADTLILRGNFYAAIEKYSEALAFLSSVPLKSFASTKIRILFSRASAFSIEGNATDALKVKYIIYFF